jgi:hypothetical protein
MSITVFRDALNTIDPSSDNVIKEIVDLISQTDAVMSEITKVYNEERKKINKTSEFKLPLWTELETIIAAREKFSNVVKLDIKDILPRNTDRFKVVNVKHSETVSACSPKYNGFKVTPEDGIDIFMGSKVSFSVPYIQYNSYDKIYYKIYDDPDGHWNFKSVLGENSEAATWKEWKNSIHMIFWPKNDTNITRQSVVYVSWSLLDNILEVSDTPNDLILSSLGVTGEFVDTSKSYTFDILHDDFNKEILAHIVTHSSKFYILEFEKPFSEKFRMKFHYLDSDSSILINKVKNKLEITCTKITDIEKVKRDIIELLCVYQDSKQDIIDNYAKFGVVFNMDEVVVENTSPRGEKKIKALQKWGDDNDVPIFSKNSGYSGFCQRERQPMITDEPENGGNVKTFNFKTTKGSTVDVNLKCDDLMFPRINDNDVPCCFSEEPVLGKGKAVKKREKVSGGFLSKGEYKELQPGLGKLKKRGTDGTAFGCFKEWAAFVYTPEQQKSYLNEEYVNSMHEKNIYPHIYATGNDLRGYEIIFNINIFVLVDDNMKIGFEVQRGIKVRNDLPSMVLYKNYGSNREQLHQDFRYELVLHESMSPYGALVGDTVKIFDKYEDYNRMYILSDKLYKSYLSFVDYEKIFVDDKGRTTIKGQLIDTYGNLSGILTDTNLLVYTLPSAPLNVPTLKSLPELPTLEYVKESFGEPASIDTKGAWYDIGEIKNALCVPVMRATHVKQRETYTSFKIMKRTSEMILFLIRWTFQDGFTNENFIAGENTYNLSKINRRLPGLKTTSQRLQFLSKTGLIEDGRFKLPQNYIYKVLQLRNLPPVVRDNNMVTYIPVHVYHQDIYKYTFEQFMIEHTNKIIISDTIIQSEYPYILNYSGSFYLIQPVDSPEDGVAVSKTWTTSHVNLGSDVYVKDDGLYTLYLENLTNIDPKHPYGEPLLLRSGKYYAILEV